MKSTGEFRNKVVDLTDLGKKSVKLEPIRKSGKDKHTLYKGLNSRENNPDEEDDDIILVRPKRESVLDYMDDGSDDDDQMDDDYDDDDLDDDYDQDYDDEDDENEQFEDDEDPIR